MMIMFARLNAGEAMPAGERVRRRVPRPVRALAHAMWAVLPWCARVVMACARGCVRVVMACARLLRLLGRSLRPYGQLLGRFALFSLIRCSFLPAGFRLAVGGWLASVRPSAPFPPTAYGRNR